MGKDYLGKDMRKGRAVDDKEEEKDFKTLDEGDIKLLKTYGQGPYSKSLKQVEKDIVDISKRVNDLAGIKESDTGLGNPALWDLAADKQTLQSEQPLQVGNEARVVLAGPNIKLSLSGRSLHQDHQRRLRRPQVHHQRQAVRQVRGGPG